MAEKTAPARRTVILDNAARLFAEQGIGGTSVREISASVGMLSGSLYHHFASKDEMVEEILTEFLEELQGRYRSVTDSGTEPREALNQLIRITLEIIRDFPYATQIYQNEVAYIQKLPSPPVRAPSAATSPSSGWKSSSRASPPACSRRTWMPTWCTAWSATPCG